MIRGVIFDLDGTLVDSNELHVLAWHDTFRHFHKDIPLERLRQQIGKGGDQYLPVFLNDLELRGFGQAADKFHAEVFKKQYLPHVKPFPKVRELFERLRADGKKIALASSGKEEDVRLRKASRHQRLG
jgi:beta-phosphoglucomutase-like phosphatase (HAD superfamily)